MLGYRIRISLETGKPKWFLSHPPLALRTMMDGNSRNTLCILCSHKRTAYIVSSKSIQINDITKTSARVLRSKLFSVNIQLIENILHLNCSWVTLKRKTMEDLSNEKNLSPSRFSFPHFKLLCKSTATSVPTYKPQTVFSFFFNIEYQISLITTRSTTKTHSRTLSPLLSSLSLVFFSRGVSQWSYRFDSSFASKPQLRWKSMLKTAQEMRLFLEC